MRPLVFLYFLLAITTVQANVRERPQTPSELGFSYEQSAYSVEGKLLWMNEKALKRDFPELGRFSTRELKHIILKNGSVVTELQLTLRGSVIGDFAAKPTTKKIFHPSAYTRAGDVTIEVPELGTIPGLFDLKAPGYSPEGIQKVKDFFAPLEQLKGNAPIAQSDLDWVLEKLKRHQAEFEATTRKTARDETAIYRKKHVLAQAKKRIEIYTLLKTVYEKSLQGHPPGAKDVHAYIELLGTTDYINGGAAADRLLKEVLIQSTTQAVFDKFNALTNSNLQTVENYFVIELPFKMRTPGGIKPAGIIGRQAHWRFSNLRDLEMPQEVGVSDLLTGRRCQCDVFGAIVDFENIDIKGLGPDYSEKIIPARIQKAMDAFPLWRGHSIKRLVEQSIAEAERISFDQPLESKNLLGAAEHDFVGEILRKTANGSVTREELATLQSRQLLGIFVARIIQLIHQDSKAGGALIRNLIAPEFETSDRFLVETIFPLVQLDEGEFAKTIQTVVSYASQDDAEDDSRFEKILMGINTAVTFELVKRQAASQSLLHQQLWLGPESMPFVFLTIWMHQFLKTGVRAPEFDILLNEAVLELPESTRSKFLEIVDNVLKMYQGKMRLPNYEKAPCSPMLTAKRG